MAVVFLLDMSASTAEAIDEGRPTVDDHDAPDDPVEYMMWLRSRREGLVRRHYKRIIALEKESTALLIQALETIGDTYGIYGFSGYGRENVEFYVIKDIEESFQGQNQETHRQGDADARHAHGSRSQARHVQAGDPGSQDEDSLPHQRRQAPGPGLQPRGSREGVRRPRYPHGPGGGQAEGRHSLLPDRGQGWPRTT